MESFIKLLEKIKRVLPTRAVFNKISDNSEKNSAPRKKTNKGQSFTTFYILGQIYKFVLKLDGMHWLRKYFVTILGHYTLKYSQSNFFHRCTMSNLGTLFYTSPRLKLFFRHWPDDWSREKKSHLKMLAFICFTNYWLIRYIYSHVSKVKEKKLQFCTKQQITVLLCRGGRAV